MNVGGICEINLERRPVYEGRMAAVELGGEQTVEDWEQEMVSDTAVTVFGVAQKPSIVVIDSPIAAMAFVVEGAQSNRLKALPATLCGTELGVLDVDGDGTLDVASSDTRGVRCLHVQGYGDI